MDMDCGLLNSIVLVVVSIFVLAGHRRWRILRGQGPSRSLYSRWLEYLVASRPLSWLFHERVDQSLPEQIRGGGRPNKKPKGNSLWPVNKITRMMTDGQFTVKTSTEGCQRMDLDGLNKLYNQIRNDLRNTSVRDPHGGWVSAADVIDDWMENREILRSHVTDSRRQLIFERVGESLARLTTDSGSRTMLAFRRVEELNLFAELANGELQVSTAQDSEQTISFDDFLTVMGGVQVRNSLTGDWEPLTDEKVKLFNDTASAVTTGSTWRVATNEVPEPYTEDANAAIAATKQCVRGAGKPPGVRRKETAESTEE